MDPRRGLVIGSAEASAPEQKYSLAEHTGAESGHGEGTPPRGDPANQLLDGDPQLFLGRPARVRQPCRPRHDRAALGLDGERAPRDLMPGIGLFIALRPRPDGDRAVAVQLGQIEAASPKPGQPLANRQPTDLPPSGDLPGRYASDSVAGGTDDDLGSIDFAGQHVARKNALSVVAVPTASQRHAKNAEKARRRVLARQGAAGQCQVDTPALPAPAPIQEPVATVPSGAGRLDDLLVAARINREYVDQRLLRAQRAAPVEEAPHRPHRGSSSKSGRPSASRHPSSNCCQDKGKLPIDEDLTRGSGMRFSRTVSHDSVPSAPGARLVVKGALLAFG